MVETMRLSRDDWLKLENWTDSMAEKVERKIKAGYYERDDVKSELRLSYVRLALTWRPGPLGVTSYIWKWAVPMTAKRLCREIRRIAYDLTEIPEADWTQQPRRACRELVCDIYKTMTKQDQRIADEIMEGLSYAEIGKKHGMTDMEVLRRMRRYGAGHNSQKGARHDKQRVRQVQSKAGGRASRRRHPGRRHWNKRRNKRGRRRI